MSVARYGDRTTTDVVLGMNIQGIIQEGSPNVRVNGISVARQGDLVIVHATDENNVHIASDYSYIATGSSTVRVNGVPIAKVGGLVDRMTGDDAYLQIATGSNNVHVG